MLTGASFAQMIDAYLALLKGSVGSLRAISATLTEATPLILTGLCVALVGFALTLLNSGFDEITNPRLQLERPWRAHLANQGQEPTRSTPVVPDRG